MFRSIGLMPLKGALKGLLLVLLCPNSWLQMLHFTCQSGLGWYQSVSHSWDINNSPVHVSIHVWACGCTYVRACVSVFVCRQRGRGILRVDIKLPQLPLASTRWTANWARCSGGWRSAFLYVRLCVHASSFSQVQAHLSWFKQRLWSGLEQGQNQGPICQPGPTGFLSLLSKQTNNAANHQTPKCSGLQQCSANY